MRHVRRYFKEGNTYFLTHVTYERRPILTDHFDLPWSSINRYHEETPFELVAWVVLPDHWHCVIDPLGNNLASLMKKIKLSFAQKYLRRQGRMSGKTWQNRYWDHIIRDREDMNRHIDYIHYNPVKHGLVNSTAAYPHSSFAEFVRESSYDSGWGVLDSVEIEGGFGE